MTSGIERYGVIASVPQGLTSPSPRVTGLTTAVLKDDKWLIWVTPGVPGDCETSSPGPGVHRGRRSR